MERRCPVCGTSERDKPFIGNLCIDCYLAREELIFLPKLELKICNQCGKARIGGKWVELDKASLARFLESKIKTKLENARISVIGYEISRKKIRASLEVAGKIEGSEISLETEVEISVKRAICPICQKIKTEYWEAKLQLRGADPRRALRLIQRVVKGLALDDPRARVWRVQETKEGIDVYFGSKKIARKVLKKLKSEFKTNIKESYKLVGEDVHKGKRKYKVTYSIRLGENK